MMQEFKEFAVKGNVIKSGGGRDHQRRFRQDCGLGRQRPDTPLVGALFNQAGLSSLFVVLGTVPPGTTTTLDALKSRCAVFACNLHPNGGQPSS